MRSVVEVCFEEMGETEKRNRKGTEDIGERREK